MLRSGVAKNFHQSGPADRKVFGKPPAESKLCSALWPLPVAGFGLINADSKLQPKSDNALLDLGLRHVSEMLQLFMNSNEGGSGSLFIIKIIDENLPCGHDDELELFEHQYDRVFKLGPISHGPSKLRFNGLSIVQADDFSRTINSDDKLEALEAFLINCSRRRMIQDELNAHKSISRMFVNSSMYWLGTTVSPFCAFYSTHLLQMLPSCKIQVLISQINELNLLKRYGAASHYFCPNRDATDSIDTFSDASHTQEGSQLCFIIGLVYGNISKDSVFHLLD